MRHAWLRRPKVDLRAVDVTVAIALSVGALADAARLGESVMVAWGALPALPATAAVATRRLHPVLSAVVALSCAAGYELATHDPRFTFVPYALLLTTYMLGRTDLAARRLHRTVLALALPAFVVMAVGARQPLVEALSSWLVFAVAPYLVGAVLDRRQRDIGLLRRRIAGLVEERELHERWAVQAERLRVARDLHDVTARYLTEMVIHAGAARVRGDYDARGARAALSTVAETGSTALLELCRLGDDEPAGSRSRLLELVTSLPAASVTVDRPTEVEAVPVPVDAAARRLVEEALTNAARHAPGAAVAVEVRVTPDALHLAVVNAASSSPAHADGAGYGLIGMRERVAQLGGDVAAGETAGGGYAVRARLPLTSAAVSPTVRTTMPWDIPWDLSWTVPSVWALLLGGQAALSPHRSDPLWVDLAIVLLMASASALRRTRPVLFLVVVAVSDLLLSGGLTSRDYATLTGLYSVTVPLYAVGSWASRRTAPWTVSLWAVAVAATGIAQGASSGGVLGPAVAGLVAAGLGVVAAEQRDLRARLTETEARISQQSATLRALAVEQERARLVEVQNAGVARHVENMVSAARAAHDLPVGDPDFEMAVAAIEREGREALARMR
ncbi:MAG: hypothetical protein JOZ82_05070, partial [Marmoricola sp.]|nr:hypothetical protein [Marmoricola sp.]